MPWFPFNSLPDGLGAIPEAASNQDVNLGLQDAHGNWIRGKLITFRVHIVGAPGLPSTEETFGVSEQVRWPMLGLTWFKKIGVHFRNFGSHRRGPGFALYVDRPRVSSAG